MDKNAIKKYAVWARNELIARVTQKAEQYEITEKKTTPTDADSINGRLLTDAEKNQRKALIEKIQADGFEQVMEEVAYTWFNRFTALRFMEVNNYLPSHTRVFTNEAGEFKPQILADAIQLDLEGLDMEKVFELKGANKTEELYKYLIITQCNALSSILPFMFQKIEHYTELLLPDYLLREGSVIEQMINLIPEEDWTDQVQIIGWLYQYYNTEPKDKLINAKKQYKSNDIPFVTQLFTSDWIVRYLVQNSLGRRWMESNPNSELKNDWEFYLDSDSDEDINTTTEGSHIEPEELTVLDPCMGSGHILVYAFDVLVQIYESCGYSAREAVEKIVSHNLYGLDIDQRAAQLAYFSVMMKARQYDRRFFSRGICPNIIKIADGEDIDKECINTIANGNIELENDITYVCESLRNSTEYGALLTVKKVDFSRIKRRLEEMEYEPSLVSNLAISQFIPVLKTAEALSENYEIVISNPPYMATKYMTPNLKGFVTENYQDFKADLFAVFIVRFSQLCKKNGHIGVLTPYVWMFIQSYEKLRQYVYSNLSFTSLVQLEFNAFEAACVPVAAFTFKNCPYGKSFDGIRLSAFKGIDVQEPKTIEAAHNRKCGYRFRSNQALFSKIPGAPVAYWAPDSVFKVFDGVKLGDIAEPRQGMTTSDNNRFLRRWYEVNLYNINFSAHSLIEAKESGMKWFPYNKGGGYRKWYGNNEYVVNYQDDGREMKEFHAELNKTSSGGRIKNQEYYFKESITWTFIAITPGFRECRSGFIFDVAGSSMFIDPKIKKYALGFLCSSTAKYLLEMINPTMNIQSSDIRALPLIIDETKKARLEELVDICVELSKEDWDAIETSWDFEKYHLIKGNYIKDSYALHVSECKQRYTLLKNNETEINDIVRNIYGLADAVDTTVSDEEITIKKANLEDDVKGLISYAVGCMFGRYSLDDPGIAYAGGVWDITKYSSFKPDKDGIIPICDDEYFEDDIVSQFVKFIEAAYGADALEENLRFIADVLGGKGASRDVIRNYFITDFYADHLKLYQKRPIYWLFDSGKKNGFKCLVYIHRYQPDTIARIRTDYVHEQQSRYRTAIIDLESRIANHGTAERLKLSKQMDRIRSQAEELRIYEEKIHHQADQMIRIDLDDGVKENYSKFQDVLAKIK